MTGRLVVLDASAAVDLVFDHPPAGWLTTELTGRSLAAPAHFHSEVLSTIGRMVRRDDINSSGAERAVAWAARLPVQVHELPGLIEGAWSRRGHIQLKDALYVELAARLDTVVVTTDRRLARATPYAVAPPE